MFCTEIANIDRRCIAHGFPPVFVRLLQFMQFLSKLVLFICTIVVMYQLPTFYTTISSCFDTLLSFCVQSHINKSASLHHFHDRYNTCGRRGKCFQNTSCFCWSSVCLNYLFCPCVVALWEHNFQLVVVPSIW
jgi:hypothetical protein